MVKNVLDKYSLLYNLNIMKIKKVLIIGLSLFGLVFLEGKIEGKKYRIGISPSHVTSSFNSVLRDTDGWSFVSNEINLFKYHAVQLMPKTESGYARFVKLDPKLLVKFSKKFNVDLGCEFGGFRPHLTSDASLSLLSKLVDPIFESGGNVTSLHLDGAIRRLIAEKNPIPFKDTIRLLTEFITKVKLKYKGIKVGLITNFPNWDYTQKYVGFGGSYTDKTGIYYFYALNALDYELKKSNAKIDFIEIDCPFQYFVSTHTRNRDSKLDNLAKFRHLQIWCDKRKINFDMIVNAEPRRKGKDDFHYLSQKYVKIMRDNFIFPDTFMFQSWYKNPVAHYPEDKKYTFMNTAKNLISSTRKLYQNYTYIK